jgi:myosin heavy subunit
MSFSRDSKQKLTTVAAVIIVALLGINAFLLWNKISQEKVIATKDAELNESDRIKAELEKTYYESLSELEEMRGNNEELNGMIDKQKEELKAQKDKIYAMIKDGKGTEAELSTVRQKMLDFKTQLDQYLAENNALRQEKEQLSMANNQLSSAKAALDSTLSEELRSKQELLTAKAALASEKESLESVNANLNTKVTRASVIDVKELEVVGEKVKNSGKPVSKKYAKSIDRLKICFTAEANMVSEKGLERFFIRIINPIGETVAMEDKGSGIMKLAGGGDEIRYTSVKELDYNREEMATCFYWEQPTYQSGKYEVEIYNKGYVAGKTSFTLK